jgi:FdhD protein
MLTLIGEAPLSIRIDHRPYSVVMRTPGDEISHVAGLCLAEGIIDTPKDVGAIGFCRDTGGNEVNVTLTEERRKKIPELLDRHGYVSQTSCGICGKGMIQDLNQQIQPLSDETVIDIHWAHQMLETLADHQPLRQKTRAAHAAAIYSKTFELLSTAEDVGRHNALDKAVGKLFLAGTLSSAVLLVLSSRISYELVQKAARARIPVILAMSRPTELAVMLAFEMNMTLACMARESGLHIFTAVHRLASK